MPKPNKKVKKITFEKGKTFLDCDVVPHRRAKHTPNTKSREVVHAMIDDGKTLGEVGAVLGIDARTVRRYYGKDIRDFISTGGNIVYQINDEDREAIEGMALAGITQEKIAQAVHISVDTLLRYYRDELDNSVNFRLGMIANKVVEGAERKEFANSNAFFLLKCKGNWRDNDKKEIAQNFTSVMQEIANKLPD